MLTLNCDKLAFLLVYTHLYFCCVASEKCFDVVAKLSMLSQDSVTQSQTLLGPTAGGFCLSLNLEFAMSLCLIRTPALQSCQSLHCV